MHDDAPPAAHRTPDPPRCAPPSAGSCAASAGALRTSPARIDGPELRRELGRGGFTTRDVDDLLARGVPDDDGYRALARRATVPDRWQTVTLASIRAEL